MVALLVMAAGVLVPPVGGIAVAAERIEPAAGAPVPVHVVNGFESSDDLLAAAVFGDLQTFWGAELPRLGTEFEPLRGGYASVDGSGSGSGALCVSPAATLLGNAYYCRADDGIVYDSAALVPVLLDQYGTAGLTASLAHEFGHAVQARSAAPAGSQASTPAILQEARADCDAGAFLAWLVVADGGSAVATASGSASNGSGTGVTGSATTDPETGPTGTGTAPGPSTTAGSGTVPGPSSTAAPGTAQATGTSSAPVSTSAPSSTAAPDTGPATSERSANASSTEAPSALSPGSADSGRPAHAGPAGDHVAVHLPASSLLRAVSPLIEFRDPVDTEVTSPQAHGFGLDRLRAALAGIRGGAAACSALTVEGLRLTEGRIRGVDTSKARFASGSAVDRAAEESIRAFDPTALPNNGSTAASPGDLRAAAPFGQFARAATTALAAGDARFGADRPQAAACYLGAWTGFVYGKADTGQLGSWPGDADEAMDMMRSREGATFEELAAFATGFDEGLPSCG